MDRYRGRFVARVRLPPDSPPVYLRRPVDRHPVLHHLAAVFEAQARPGRTTNAGGVDLDLAAVSDRHCSGRNPGGKALEQPVRDHRSLAEVA
jgi:hypothetical protein